MGGIGSGKSAVARLFAETGAQVIDADAICTELHRTPELKRAVRERWGEGVLGADGELDRPKLAAVVFDDPAELERLNQLVRPKVVARTEEATAAWRAADGPALCVIDAPLLLESGLARLCDVTVFVDCDRATRGERIARDRGWSPDEIGRRESRQAALSRKRERADFVVRNDGGLAETKEQVESIVAQLLKDGV